MIVPKIEVKDTFSRVLATEFSESRIRPDLAKAINRIMQQWVSYAMKKVPVADRQKIKARMLAPATRAKFKVGVRKVSKKGKEASTDRYMMLKHSVAAYLVWSMNWRPRGGTPARQVTAAQFYGYVGTYAAARPFAAGYHKSGLVPALNQFRVAGGQVARLPKYRDGPPGTAKEAKEGERIPMAEVENYAKAILKVAPNAFSDSLPEMERTVKDWIVQNLNERAKRAGVAGP